jgi:hypothetical protein
MAAFKLNIAPSRSAPLFALATVAMIVYFVPDHDFAGGGRLYTSSIC